ncbi:hypothetical protein AAYQ05_10655 [Flavobacterium sp. B11]|uniref:hypothetical protein n=1 Tax=Flavobacterium movens TaxID=214860 RepID=UPI0031D9C620
MEISLKQPVVNKRFSLPENIYLLEKTSVILGNGKFVALGHFNGGEYYAIITIYNEKLEYKILEDLGEVFKKYHGISLIAIDDNHFAIIDNADSIYIFNDINQKPSYIKIDNISILDTFSKHGQAPRVYNYSVISNNEYYNIVFSEPICSTEARYIAELNVNKEKGKAEWEKIYSIYDKKTPIIGHSLYNGANFYVFLEGSDHGSVNRYGMDFYALVELDFNGKLIEKIYEVSGLKNGSKNPTGKKYGIRGNFTSSAEYLIMTPVFKSDDWKGKQKLFSIKEKKLIDIQLPRGAKDFRIIEHKYDVFWLTDFDNEILIYH